MFCAGPVLSAFVSSRFAFGRVRQLFPSLSLLRFAADEVRPQCLGEALTRGGVARARGTSHNEIFAILLRLVIGAGQAHDFGLSKSFAEQLAVPTEAWSHTQRTRASKVL